MIEVDEEAIRRLDPKPRDIIVIHGSGALSRADRQRAIAKVEAIIESMGVEHVVVIVVEAATTVEVLRQEDRQ